MPILGAIGILANTIVITALTRSEELSAHFFNWLLTVVTIIDSLFLACGIYEAIRQNLDDSPFMDLIHVTIIYPFRSMLMLASIYMIVLLAYERHKAVSTVTAYEGNVNRMSHPWWHLMKYVMPVISGSIIFYLPKFWELKLKYSTLEASVNATYTEQQNISNKSSGPEIIFTPFRHNRYYVLWYVTIGCTFVTSILPFSLLVYLNSKVYFGLQRFIVRRRTLIPLREDKNTPSTNQRTVPKESHTTVLFLMVSVFFVCNILRLILNISEIINHENERKASENECLGVYYWMLIATVISNTLVYLNSSVNLFVYCIANPRLREILMTTMIRPTYDYVAKLVSQFW